MIKEHLKTGKKYLCIKTTDSDTKAMSYTGSGVAWKQHLRENGNVFKTTILYKCHPSQRALFSKICLEYSGKFDVVKDEEWMNLIPENGQYSHIRATKDGILTIFQNLKIKF